jgi:hypothetical protein
VAAVEPSRKLALGLSLVVLALAGIAIRALALSYPLSSTAIRDAYFLGNRNDEQTGAFLAQYVHPLPQPKSGPYVYDIGIHTPFAEVVRRSARYVNFNAPDAVEEFQGKRMPFRVFVDIALTDSYQPIGPSEAPEDYQWVPDFWNDFKVSLLQDDKGIPAEQVRGGPVYSYGYDETPMVTGARIEVIYDPEKIDAKPARIVVLTPDGQTVETTFNLAKLR